MSKFILGEKISKPRLLSTGISFIMILGIVDFKNISLGSSIIILLFGSYFFAVSDIINKKYSLLENHITSIFYYNIFAFSVSVPLALKTFVMPSFIDLIYMICLGFEANIYSFSLLRAFSLADATFLTPFKYFEFVFSVFLGYVFFNEIPTAYCFVVILVIVINNSSLLYIEKTNSKNK
jgi:S-adenosylmethionine uptake transporter